MPAVDAFLKTRLVDFNFAFVLSDPTKKDNPISYASSKFYELTGYSPEEVLGRNCRFLQGPETEQRKVGHRPGAYVSSRLAKCKRFVACRAGR
jgi:phototropin